MNRINYYEVRSDFLYTIGKNMDSWHLVIGKFCEKTMLGEYPHSETVKAAGYSDFHSMTIHYHPETGWSRELN